MDAETHRALWVCKGKAGADVKAFFELLKEKKLADKIRSVSMDMNACFPSLVRQYCPNATVLYDLFHVLQMFTRNVLVPAKKHCQDAVLKRLDTLNTPPKPAKKKARTQHRKNPWLSPGTSWNNTLRNASASPNKGTTYLLPVGACSFLQRPG